MSRLRPGFLLTAFVDGTSVVVRHATGLVVDNSMTVICGVAGRIFMPDIRLARLFIAVHDIGTLILSFTHSDTSIIFKFKPNCHGLLDNGGVFKLSSG